MQKQPSHLPLAIISVILSGLIFGLLGYWYGADVNSAPTSTASPTATASSSPVAVASSTPTAAPTSTPIATPDPTAGWKTYNSTTEKLSFKYPATWTMNNIGTVDPANTDGIQITSPNETTVVWQSSVSGLGGMCDDPNMHTYIIKSDHIAGSKGLYMVETGSTTTTTTHIGVIGAINNLPPKIGIASSCPNLFYTLFKSQTRKSPGLNPEYVDMWLETNFGPLNAIDVSTVRLIIGSLNTNL